MRNRIVLLLAIPAAVFVGWALPGPAQDRQGSPEGSAEIAKNAEAFIEAFHKGDAKALAAFWTPDGEYTDQSGRVLKGRQAIEHAFQSLFAEAKDLKLRIDSDSLRFVTPDIAIEKGTTTVMAGGGAPPSRAHFTIVHVKKDGQWLLDSVRDTPFVPPANYEKLRGLEWAIGEWTGNTDTGEAERLSFDWTENQNFIVSSFTTTAKNVSVGDATVWIGWDPAEKKIRAWLFDSTGGF
ncbi:MAG TPA: SgcJ/EcaC family oxidoreductase, partial [Gemmataceae bacterium]|nr:SgcJ/EcaC family oxidoreductase [Gemmataceae bacterium]